MKRILQRVIFFVVMQLGAVVAAASAPEFSADVITKGENQSYKGKMYYNSKSVRMEFDQGVSIARFDKNVAWVLLPEQQVYLEQPLTPNDLLAVSTKIPGELSRVSRGQERIRGILADKFEVSLKQKGKVINVYQWVDSSIDMPIKTAMVDDSWSLEYLNFENKAQPAYLFEIPAGYVKIDQERY